MPKIIYKEKEYVVYGTRKESERVTEFLIYIYNNWCWVSCNYCNPTV